MSLVQVPPGVGNAKTVKFLLGSPTPPAFEALNSDEMGIFDDDIARLASMYSKEGANLGDLWYQDRDTLYWATCVAKKTLAVEFRGLRALGSSSFGMQPIRPIYINATQTWQVSRATTGWAASAFNVNLATTTAGAQNTQNRVLLCATRYANEVSSPKVAEIRNTVGPTTYGVERLRWGYFGGMYISKGIGALLIGKNGTFTTDFNVEFTGIDGTALWGLAFGTGDWMNQET